MERTHQWLGKQRPDVLRARDDNHADQPKQQLNPPRAHYRIHLGVGDVDDEFRISGVDLKIVVLGRHSIGRFEKIPFRTV